ncbi:MAG: Asp-tRNA(Asn)/Glu-tRNA(Gln) amidotransferase subunit GatC [Terriglobales bacterium]
MNRASFDLEAIASLAQLELSAEEAAAMRRDLEAILGYIAQIQQIATAGVAPMAHALAAETPLRDDRVQPSFSQEEALANAPERRQGMFQVPQILERA